MHFSDSSKSSDSSRSSGASASVSQLLSYWQYYRRKFHLLWRALFICDHRGFTFHPSSNYHHYHHFIITLSSHHHHYHQIIITLSSHCHPQLVKITSLITSAGKDYISWKGSQTTEREEKRCSTVSQSRSAICSTLTWVGWLGWSATVDTVYRRALCTLRTVYTSSLSSCFMQR